MQRRRGSDARRFGAFTGLDPKVEFGPSFRGVPFAVIQWRMAPHAVLPAHCRPQASVGTVGRDAVPDARNAPPDRIAAAH
ncbi:MAG TPA: hypothetical protein VMT86_19115 [Bryobacteraceae bacterium]|nr:hypothetical protein [Bryobacteraceae bacterium]